MAFDISVNDSDDKKPWDFNNPELAEKARRIIENKRAVLLVGSPIRTKTSDDEIRRKLESGTSHIEFAIELYKIQIKKCLYFMHEHPAYATSWNLESMQFF